MTPARLIAALRARLVIAWPWSTLAWLAGAAVGGALVGWLAIAAVMPAPPRAASKTAELASAAAPASNRTPPPASQAAALDTSASHGTGRPDTAPDNAVASRLPHAGPPHTMPEITLLLAAGGEAPALAKALEQTPPAAKPGQQIVARGSWSLAELIPSNPAMSTSDAPAVTARPGHATTAGTVQRPVIGRTPLPSRKPIAPAEPVSEHEGGSGNVAIAETGRTIGPGPASMARPKAGSAPLVAIIIDDLGLDVRNTARVTALPAPITMSFMAYANHLGAQTAKAAAAGHELFLHLPMEPIDPQVNPGPEALVERLGRDEFLRRLAWNLDRFHGYVGVNNHMGSLLTQDRGRMNLVMKALARRGLMFVDSMTTADSVAYAMAQKDGVPSARRDVFLDDVPKLDAVLTQLGRLENIARRQGYAIGIGHPHDATIAALARWLPEAAARGVVIVPASRVVEANEVRVAEGTGE